ncbi:MAG: lanthionine synthetase C family protein [Myxococcales bacterium]|nr:lanthionine synthetase C family protein [Myxococcales bacterium]
MKAQKIVQHIIDELKAELEKSTLLPAGIVVANSPVDPYVALLFSYAWATDKSRSDIAAYAVELLDAISASCAAAPNSLRPNSGVIAADWVYSHYCREFFERDPEHGNLEDETSDDIEVALVVCKLLKDAPPRAYDLASGLVGLGIYGLESTNTKAGTEIVSVVLSLLADRSEPVDSLRSRWLTPRELLFGSNREAYPDGVYDLGVAHGVPGIIAFAAESYARGIAREVALDIAGKAVEWILSVRVLDGGPGYDSWVEHGKNAYTGNQVAWCYGGLGLAATVLRAAQVFSRSDWHGQAVNIARACADVSLSSFELRSHALCHGSAGIAHIFNRMYHATNDPIFKRAAVSYYEACVGAFDPAIGFGGYLDLATIFTGKNTQSESMTTAKVGSWNFLTGTSGIGAALLAAIGDVEPLWDRLLLTTIMPKQ